MLLTDDRLVGAMRDFVTATNRLQHIESQTTCDLHQQAEASLAHRHAAAILQEALVERGWRRPGAHADVLSLQH